MSRLALRRSWPLFTAAVAALVLVALTATADRSEAHFRASTANADAVISGLLELSNDRSAPGALVDVERLVPGDTVARQVTLRNDGHVPFTYVIGTSQTASTALWTDRARGLQVSVHRGKALLYSGSLAGLTDVPSAIVLRPGDDDTLVFVFSLPSGAANDLQGLRQDLVVTYAALEEKR